MNLRTKVGEPSARQLLERWQQAQRVLEEMSEYVIKNRFYMGSWGWRTECGTVACLAGHCGMDPWFRQRGFIFKPRPLGTGRGPPVWGLVNAFPAQLPRQFFGDRGTENVLLQTSAWHEETLASVKREIAWLKWIGAKPR
jgi:hypothetical protein